MKTLKRIFTALAVAIGLTTAASAYTSARVISMNFGNQGAAPDSAGIVPVSAAAWNNVTAAGNTRTDLKTWNGTEATTLSPNWSITWSAGAVWDSSDTDIILKGYLDDNDTNQATATFNSIPFEYYDIYIYKAADSSTDFSPVSLTQGDVTTSYTCGSSGIAMVGTGRWGQTQQKTCKMGTNVICIQGVSGSSVTIKGGKRNDGRGALAAIQIVETSAPAEPVDYSATISESVAWAGAGWDPELPETGMTANDTATVTATGTPTLTLDGTITVGSLKIKSEADNMLTIKKAEGANTSFGSVDVSEATDGTTWDATEGFTACSALLNAMRAGENKFYFLGEGENGATITYERAGTKTFPSHLVFEGGKHKFTYGQDSQRDFGANATEENPTILVKDGTILDFYGHDLCGWSGAANLNGIIKIEDGGRIYMKQEGGNGTVYYRQRISLDPGGQFYVDMQANNFRLQGGVSEEKAQIYVPESEGGVAYIKPVNATRDSIYLAHDSTRGFAVSVGEGSTLDIQTKIACQEDNGNQNDFEIGKYGAGLLKLSGDISGYGPQGYDKVVKFSAYAGDIELASATEAKCRFWLNTGLNLRLTGADTTVSGLITGDGNVVRNGEGTITLTAANGYTGTTTVTAGTLTLAEGATLGSGNYTVEEGATLDLGTYRPGAKMATSAGTVCVTLSSSEQEQFDEEQQIELFDVVDDASLGALRVFDADGNEYLNEFVVEGGKVKATKVDQKTPPYNLAVTADKENFWELFGWLDSNPEGSQKVTGDDWALKVAANIAVSDGATTEMKVGAAVPITLSTLTIANGSKLTIIRDDDATITVDAINDSASTGTTTLDFPTHAANITAGANTIVQGGGTGALTIGAEMTATIKGGIWAGTVTRDNASTIRFAGTAGTTTVPYVNGDSNTGLVIYAADFGDLGTGGLQFANTLTRKFEDGFVMTGGRFVMGNQASHTQNITMDGGSITVTGNTAPTASTASTLFAHWNSTVNFTMNGGTFTAENAAARLGWDGKAYVTVTGGKLRTKGIKSGDERDNDASFTLSDGTLELGDFGIQGLGTAAAYTFSGGTIKSYANTSILVKHADGLQVTGPVVLDATDGDITFEGKVTFTDNGAFEIVGGTVIFKPAAGVDSSKVTVTSGNVYYGFTVGINDMGKFTIPEGYTADQIKLFDQGGNPVDFVENEGVLEFEWKYTGGACWWDYEFNEASGQNPQNTGANTTRLELDGDRSKAMKDAGEYATNIVETIEGTVTNIALRVPNRPWRDVSSWPAEATFMFYGTMVGKDKAYQIAFGSKNGSSNNNQLFFATESVADGTVDLCYSVAGAAPTVLCTMNVPNAQKANHLYAVVLKDDGNGNTVVNTYLDGKLLQPYKHTGTLTLGKGFQIASGHGGVAAGGYGRPDDDDPATMDWLRVYDVELNAKAMEALADIYYYVSENGEATRTVTSADTAWVADDTWTQVTTEGSMTTNAPFANTMVEVTVNENVTLALNLTEKANYEALEIKGDGALTLTGAEDAVVPAVSGVTTIGTDVTVAYEAITFGNVTIADGKTLTFDFSSLDLSKEFTSRSIKLTGVATLGENATVNVSGITEVAGRTTELVYDDNTKQYSLVITVEDISFNYADGVWTWGEQEVDAETVSNNTAIAIYVNSDLTWDIDRNDITVTKGTLTVASVTKRAAAVTVDAAAVLDLNGNQAKEMSLTLNGGKVTYGNTKLGEADQIKVLTLTDDSEINTPVKGQIYAAGYATATTIALDSYTLTKTGTDVLQVVNTDITGTGTIDIQEGEFYGSEDTRAEEGVTFKIAKGATLHNRGGKTMTIAKIEGAGGTLNNEGTISAFALTGSLKLANAGTFGTITLDIDEVDTTLDVGNKRDFTLDGNGTVDVTLTAAEESQYEPIVVFTSESEDVVIDDVYDHNGTHLVIAEDYTVDGGTITMVEKLITITIPDVDNTTKEVEVSEGEATLVAGTTYQVKPGVTVTVTYTADKGYLPATSVATLENAKEGDTVDISSVEIKQAEAKIGDVYYLTLQEALNVGGDVVILKDITSEVTVPADTTINLNFNGFAITTTSRQAINNYGTLTIANGNITAQESAIVLWGNSTTTISGGDYTANDNAVIMGSGNEGEGNVTLTITDGTFNGTIKSAGYIACGLYVPNSGTYTIDGGTFNITGGCGICARAGEIKVASKATFNLGGSTEPGKVGDSARLVPCVAMFTDYEAAYPGYAETDFLKAQDNTLTTAETQVWVGPDADSYYTLAKLSDEAEAKIGDTYYLTLQEALNVGGDVVILKDITSEVTIPAGKTVNLDFNGFKITTTSRQAINNRGTLTIANGNVTAQESAIVLWGNSVTTISGGDYTANDNAVIMGSGNDGEGNVTLTITGGTFNGTIESAGYIACGIYVPNSGTYTISGGTFNITGGCGICARAGEIKVASKATFNLGGSTEPGKVGDSARLVPCVAMFTDYEAAYPGYAETDFLKAQDNTLTTADGFVWGGPDKDGYYTLTKPTLPTVSVDEYEGEMPEGLDTAYTYTLDDKGAGYDDWNVDYFVSFDKAIAADTVTLKGQYGAYQWQGKTLDATAADTEIQLVPFFTTKGVTVAEMAAMVTFNCGAGDTGANAGTTMTVTLKMFKDGEETIVLDTQTYTFEAKGPQPAPGSDVDVKPVPGAENTYTVEPTGESKDVTIQGVKDGDTLIIEGAKVDSLTFNTDVTPTVVVKNANGTTIPNGAFYGLSGNTFNATLDPNGEVDGVKVQPTIETSEEIPTPFVVGTDASTTIKAIPGLTYTLKRGTEIGTYADEADTQVATSTTVTLTDNAKPTDKAFYKVQVTK